MTNLLTTAPANRAAYIETILNDIETLANPLIASFTITQSTEPTQKEWETAWVTAGNSLPIPASVELYWNDGYQVRGMFMVVDDVICMPTNWAKIIDEYPDDVTEPQIEARVTLWVRWWFNNTSLIAIGSVDGVGGTYRVFLDGSYELLFPLYALEVNATSRKALLWNYGSYELWDLDTELLADIVHANQLLYDYHLGDPTVLNGNASFIGLASWTNSGSPFSVNAVQLVDAATPVGNNGTLEYDETLISTSSVYIQAQIWLQQVPAVGEDQDIFLYFGGSVTPNFATPDFRNGYGFRIIITSVGENMEVYWGTTLLTTWATFYSASTTVNGWEVREVNLRKVGDTLEAISITNKVETVLSTYTDSTRTLGGDRHGISAVSSAITSMDVWAEYNHISDDIPMFAQIVQEPFATSPPVDNGEVPLGTLFDEAATSYGWGMQNHFFWVDQHSTDSSFYFFI